MFSNKNLAPLIFSEILINRSRKPAQWIDLAIYRAIGGILSCKNSFKHQPFHQYLQRCSRFTKTREKVTFFHFLQLNTEGRKNFFSQKSWRNLVGNLFQISKLPFNFRYAHWLLRYQWLKTKGSFFIQNPIAPREINVEKKLKKEIKAG